MGGFLVGDYCGDGGFGQLDCCDGWVDAQGARGGVVLIEVLLGDRQSGLLARKEDLGLGLHDGDGLGLDDLRGGCCGRRCGHLVRVVGLGGGVVAR